MGISWNFIKKLGKKLLHNSWVCGSLVLGTNPAIMVANKPCNLLVEGYRPRFPTT